MRLKVLKSAFSWLVALLVLRVLASILTNYPDYFPPHFDSLFLHGREATFQGSYRIAFYTHIVFSPVVLLVGLILMSDRLRRNGRSLHRVLGYVQVSILLLFVLPSSFIMAGQAFGGWPAGLSFALLSLVTAFSTVVGVMYARRRRYDLHRLWMNRSFLLICSAVFLRLFAGIMSVFQLPTVEGEYVVSAWSSWLLPLLVYEVVLWWRTPRPTIRRLEVEAPIS